jgi:pimeloyl-ACP methyl ester carboxylesterase
LLIPQARSDMTISIIETPKGKIEFSLHGQGKAILIVHGGHIDCRETIFQKGLDPDEFCFITPSRPGYGNTPLTEANKTPKGTAALFIALLEELKVTKATVIGVSAGGLTAFEIAANHPDRVESLVLLSALTKNWFNKSEPIYKNGKRFFAPGMEQFTWFMYRLFFRLFPGMMARTMFRSLSTYRPIEYTEEELKELKQLTINMRSGHGFVNDLDQTIDESVLAGITCPTLILHSENDNMVADSHPQNALNRIKNSSLETFNNRWGHLLWLGTDYEPILRALKKHLYQAADPI